MTRAMCLLALLLISSSLTSCSGKGGAAASPDFVASAREAVSLLSKRDYAAVTARFDDSMRAAMPTEKLKEFWEQLISQMGAFKERGKARQEKVQGYDVVFVRCEFEKGRLDLQLTFDSDGRIGGMFVRPAAQGAADYPPPPYVKPGSYRQKEVTVGSGEWALPGTLTLPEGKGPFPALVLVQGSGPQDRDETIGPNKPFRDLAWGLAGEGIATLRYEKRTKQHAARLAKGADTFTVNEETVDDALAAADLLMRTDDIDPRRVYVLGHSLGGTVIPRIAAHGPRVAGFIVMAGSTRPMGDAILEQMRYIASLKDSISDQERKQMAELEKQVERLQQPGLSSSTPASELPLGIPASYWLDLRDYDPAKAAGSIARPMLLLQGERDYQVTVEDFQGWKKHLAGRPNVTFRLYPDLNHLFMAGKGKATPREYEQPGHVAEKVVRDIARWIGPASPAK